MSTELITWSPGVTLAAIEKDVILKAFRHHRGNKTQTSISLGISIRTLDNKLELYAREGKENEIRLEQQRARDDEFIRRSRGPVRGVDGSVSDEALRAYRNPDGVEIEEHTGNQIEESEAELSNEDEGADFDQEPELEADSGSAEPLFEDDFDSSEGVHVESTSKARSEHDVPVRKQKKVQKVSPRKAGQIRHTQSGR
jgi:hypothetical protein